MVAQLKRPIHELELNEPHTSNPEKKNGFTQSWLD